MMEETVSLSSSEKSKMENEKQLYVLLRTMHFLEKYYTYDRIDKSTYKTQMNKLLERYNRFSQVIPDYSLETLLKKYHIQEEEISWAKLVLDKGIHTQEKQGKEAFVFIQATAKFIETIDILGDDNGSQVVGELKHPLEELEVILKKVKIKLGSQFGSKFDEYQKLLDKSVRSKSSNEYLTQSEFNQLKLNVIGMYRMMQVVMKS